MQPFSAVSSFNKKTRTTSFTIKAIYFFKRQELLSRLGLVFGVGYFECFDLYSVSFTLLVPTGFITLLRFIK